MCPLCYVISDGEKTVLYNNDSGFFTDDVYNFLAERGFYFNAVIADCTVGFIPNHKGNGHMSFENNIVHKQRLTDIGVIDKNTIYIVTHYSHNGLFKDGKPLTAEDVEKIAIEHGMISAYDGIELEI